MRKVKNKKKEKSFKLKFRSNQMKKWKKLPKFSDSLQLNIMISPETVLKIIPSALMLCLTHKVTLVFTSSMPTSVFALSYVKQDTMKLQTSMISNSKSVIQPREKSPNLSSSCQNRLKKHPRHLISTD